MARIDSQQSLTRQASQARPNTNAPNRGDMQAPSDPKSRKVPDEAGPCRTPSDAAGRGPTASDLATRRSDGVGRGPTEPDRARRGPARSGVVRHFRTAARSEPLIVLAFRWGDTQHRIHRRQSYGQIERGCPRTNPASTMLTLIILLVMAVISTVLIRKIMAQRVVINRLRSALIRAAQESQDGPRGES
jgi:hypothetical protein